MRNANEKISTKRKALSYKIRFEVFKRDSFTCQYCGKSPPTVTLQADHVHPVAEGGTNDILNLITACYECNMGKGKRKLDDHHVINKSIEQARILNEKREQTKMMLEWRKDLQNFGEEQINIVNDYWKSLTGYCFVDRERNNIRKLIRNFGFDKLLEAMELARERYIKYDSNNKPYKESVEEAYTKISGILALDKKSVDDPHIKDIYYIRGILKKRLSYINYNQIIPLLRDAIAGNVSIGILKDLACNASSWTNFYNSVDEKIKYIVEKQTNEIAKQNQFTKNELDAETCFIGNATDLQTFLEEECQFSKKKSQEVVKALDTYCESFMDFLEDEEPNEDTIALYIKEFIKAIFIDGSSKEELCCEYRNKIKRDLWALNLFVANNFEYNVPFLYMDRIKGIKILKFHTRKQFTIFCKALEFDTNLLQEDIHLLFAMQRGLLDSITIEAAKFIGMRELLKFQFERCKMKVSLEQIERLLKFYTTETLLEWLSSWLPVWDKNGEILHYEDPDYKYTWPSFLIGLQVNHITETRLIEIPGMEKDYMLLYENFTEHFEAIFRQPNGLIGKIAVANWNEYLALLKDQNNLKKIQMSIVN